MDTEAEVPNNVGVGFIGDGLNDCVVLAQASCGITIQEIGSAATADAVDAVLQGDLGQLVAAVVITRRAKLRVLAGQHCPRHHFKSWCPCHRCTA